MVIIHQDLVRRFRGIRAQAGMGDLVAHIHGDALCAFVHEGDAEVRPMGDPRRERWCAAPR
jgi:hypothetical protein